MPTNPKITYDETDQKSILTGEGYLKNKILYRIGLTEKEPLLDVRRRENDEYLERIGWKREDFKDKSR